VDEDLVVDVAFRAAVEAALGEAVRGYLVPPDAVTELASERGILVLVGGAVTGGAPMGSRPADDRRFRERLAALGGGVLDAAVTRDGTGAARRLLARAAWLPDLSACLAIRDALPPGYRRRATVVSSATPPSLSAPGRRSSVARGCARLLRLAARGGARLRRQPRTRPLTGLTARDEADEARRRETAAETSRRRAEEAERVPLEPGVAREARTGAGRVAESTPRTRGRAVVVTVDPGSTACPATRRTRWRPGARVVSARAA
jgi:hypothetical protein